MNNQDSMYLKFSDDKEVMSALVQTLYALRNGGIAWQLFEGEMKPPLKFG